MAELLIDAIAAAGVTGETLVRIELTDGRGDPVIGYVGSNQVIISSSVATTDVNGQLSLDVEPNANIEPGNTVYTVTVGNKSFLISKTDASQSLFEALVTDPGDLDPITTGVLLAENNLSDVLSAAESRDNLGLGTSATRDVGQNPGDVAAGDDPRLYDLHNDIPGRSALDTHPATSIQSTPFDVISATDVQSALEEVFAEAPGTTDHNDLTNRDDPDQHPADAISFTPFLTVTSTNVQDAIEEVFATGGSGGTSDHRDLLFRDAVDQHPATSVSVTPFGAITAIEVQDALEQVYSAATSGLDEASEISFAPYGDISATNVQTAIEEVNDEFVHKDRSYSASSTDVLNTRVSGDTDPRFNVDADGTLRWGGGSGATDVTLQRVNANELRVPNTFRVSGTTLQADNQIRFGSSGPRLNFGTGTPEGATTAPVGSLFLRTDGSTDTSVYRKESGTGNTGWVAIASTAASLSFAPTGDIVATTVQNAIVEVDAEFHAHETKTPGAHAASAISFSPASGIAAIDAQSAIVEAKTDSQAYTDVHIANTTGAHAATAVSFAPTGDIVATTVQAAIAEVDLEFHAHETKTPGAHAASAISVTPAGNISSINVQAALTELQGDIDTNAVHNNLTGRSTAGAHPASAVAFTPGGTIAATDVQNAILETSQDVTDHMNDTIDAHDASAISFVANAGAVLSSTDVQAAIVEVANERVQVNGSFATAGTDVLSARVTGDAFPRFTLEADGSLHWGVGTATTDRILEVRTSNGLQVNKSLTFSIPITPAASAEALLQFEGFYTDANSTPNNIFGGGNFGAGMGWNYSSAGAFGQDNFMSILPQFKGNQGNRQVTAFNGDLLIANTAGSLGPLSAGNPPVAGMRFSTRAYTGFNGTITDMAALVVVTGHSGGAGTLTGDVAGYMIRPPLFTAGGTVSARMMGGIVYNQGNAAWGTCYGLKIEPQVNSTVSNNGIAIGASTHRTLWVSDNANSTTASGGITFGSSSDTTLFRSAAGTLTTQSFITTAAVTVGTALQVNGNLGFYGTTPIAKYATTGTATGFTAGAGTTATHLSTFTGNTGSTAYTMGDIVRALKLYGLLTA